MAKSTRKLLLMAMGVLWAGLTSAGLFLLGEYSHRPGEFGRVTKVWPAEISDEVLAADKPTLLVFLHPECGCSRAAIAELERVALRAARPFTIRVYFNDLETFAGCAEESSLWEAATRIPGAVLSADEEGRMTRAFGAETSGTCLLFDSGGRLLFQGGITGSRGHEGDNPNQDGLLAAIDGATTGVVQRNVYGCTIF